MHCALLHKADDLVLYSDGVIDVVIKLNLDFVFKLSILLEDLSIFDWVLKVVRVFSDKTDLSVVSP